MQSSLLSLLTFRVSLLQCGWYWGPMNWEDAEMKLKGKPDGSFLVRDSSDPRYILSLSFRSQGITHHTRMEHYRGKGPGERWGGAVAVGSLVSRSQISAQSIDAAEKREQQQRVLTLCPAFNPAVCALGTSFLKAMKNWGIEEFPTPLWKSELEGNGDGEL